MTKEQNPNDYFEVLTGEEMRKKYRLYAENRPTIKLDPSNVPKEFRQLVQLAEQWGISDDLIRSDYIEKASIEDVRRFYSTIEPYVDSLTMALGSQDSTFKRKTLEYIAFSSMRDAAYECESRIKPQEPVDEAEASRKLASFIKLINDRQKEKEKGQNP